MYKKHILTTGKEIHIYDGLVPSQTRSAVWSFINNSLFRIGWPDGTTERSMSSRYIHALFNEEDNAKCGLLPFLQTTQVQDHIKGLTLKKSIVNLSVPSDTHWAHSHHERLVVLYYANLEWEQHWHGETLFYTEDLSDIELAIRYTPGRVVVFDATIPHAVRPQSPAADNYRFTYAMTFE